MILFGLSIILNNLLILFTCSAELIFKVEQNKSIPLVLDVASILDDSEFAFVVIKLDSDCEYCKILFDSAVIDETICVVSALIKFTDC